MCRIAGIFTTSPALFNLQQTGDNMRDCLEYGGPDDAGSFAGDNIYLGHRRLAIIDISSAGHQPMYFKDWVIVFNGEIYNYEEIAGDLKKEGYTFSSHSDTEVILKAFDCWSYEAVNHFRGMFAFALWNTRTEKLLLCRDRVGVKPLYWSFKDGMFLFASETKALHQAQQFDKEIDHQALSLYFQIGYIPSPYSIFKHVKKLEPGSFLEIDGRGNIKQWKYWDIRRIDMGDKALTEQEVLQKADNLIRESCELRMVADVPVGVFLSGGIDSSLVTAILQKNSRNKIKTFTIGFKDKQYDESGHAKKIAEYLGTDHTEYICTEADFIEILKQLPEMYDEPFSDSSAIPTHLVSKIARRHVTVALSADGGDEVFAGYDRYRLTRGVYRKLSYIPLPARRFLANSINKLNPKKMEKRLQYIGIKLRGLEWRIPKFANALFAEDLFDFYEKSSSNIPLKLLARLHMAEPEHLFKSHIEAVKTNYLYSSLGIADIETYLEGDILTKVDRATMQVALEGREPLLDHKIIEFGIGLPDKYKVRKNKGKWVLRNLLSQYIPAELTNRPKQGFAIPVKEWLQNNLKEDIERMINDTGFSTLFKLDQSVLKQIVSAFYLEKGAAVNPYFIWSLYCLYSWYLHWMK